MTGLSETLSSFLNPAASARSLFVWYYNREDEFASAWSASRSSFIRGLQPHRQVENVSFSDNFVGPLYTFARS